MKKYSLKEIENAMKKQFTYSDVAMGIEIIKKPEEGDWFKELFNEFKRIING